MEVQAKQEELARLAEVAEKESHEKDELVTVILKFQSYPPDQIRYSSLVACHSFEHACIFGMTSV